MSSDSETCCRPDWIVSRSVPHGLRARPFILIVLHLNAIPADVGFAATVAPWRVIG